MRGWWKIQFTGTDAPNDTTLEHIAEQIKQGFTEGEIVENDVCEVCKHDEDTVGPLSSNENHQLICDDCK